MSNEKVNGEQNRENIKEDEEKVEMKSENEDKEKLQEIDKMVEEFMSLD